MAVPLGRLIFWFMTGLAALSLVGGGILVASDWPRKALLSVDEVDRAAVAIISVGPSTSHCDPCENVKV